MPQLLLVKYYTLRIPTTFSLFTKSYSRFNVLLFLFLRGSFQSTKEKKRNQTIGNRFNEIVKGISNQIYDFFFDRAIVER